MNRTQTFEIILKLLIAAGLGVSMFWPVSAQTPALAALDRVTAGEWQIRDRETQEKQRICIVTGRDLIQLRHQGQSCTRIVVEDGAEQVTVQYTCKGKGYARTSIRIETSSLVQIDSQGIAGDRHFAFSAEARRLGPCKG